MLVMAIFTGVARADSLDSIQELEARIAEGDAEAMGRLGQMYVQGKEIEQNVSLGLELMHAAIENGSDRTAGRLGMMYYRGLDLERDYAAAYEYLLKSSETWTIARTALNWLFYDSQPVIVFDEVKAAAENGDIQAQYDLGELYLNSLEGEVNVDKAQEWLAKAAEKGHVRAQMRLGLFYQGNGIQGHQYDDPEKMVYWLEKAAAQGDLFAMLSLVSIYTNFKPDFVGARKWLLKFAEMGHTDAYSSLADFYYVGDLVAQDYVEALRLYLLAAADDSIHAMQRLADMYAQGLGTAPDIEESQYWRLKAAYAMVPDAQYRLAEIYLEGDKLNLNQAREWRERAFDEPGLGAIHRLANYHEQQVPVEKDIDEALRWHALAALNGHAGAALFLGRVYGEWADSYGVEQDYTLAAKWYALIAEMKVVPINYILECGEAQAALARMYIKGQGVPRDLVRAYILAAKACTNDPYGGIDGYVAKYLLRKYLPAEMSKAELEHAQALLQAEGIGREQYPQP